MPEVFRYRGFKFFFSIRMRALHSSQFNIHVEKDDTEAKFWLLPVIQVAYNDGYSSRTLRELDEIVTANRDRIVRAWNDHFGI